MIDITSRINPYGFEGLSLYEIAVLFRKGLSNVNLMTGAAAIAFKFFLALFPSVILIFTIIPLLPLPESNEAIFDILREMIPTNAYPMVKQTIVDIMSRQQGGLLSIGFLLSLYFSSSGFISVIYAFNLSEHVHETRSWFQQRLTSIVLVIIAGLIIILAVVLIIVGNKTISWFVAEQIIHNKAGIQIYLYSRWVFITAMIFFSISFIYYLAPAKKTRYKFFSAGSVLSTICIILITISFRYFILFFTRYNALYGSAGTIMIIMMFIYFIAIVLLTGFELNASLRAGRKIR